MTGALTASSATTIQKIRPPVDSSLPMRRTRISDNAKNRAEEIAAICPALSSAMPGRSTISTPMKPTTTALQRRQPTFSPRIGTDSAVTTIGTAKISA